MNLGFQGWFLTQPHTGIAQHCIGLLRELKKSKKAKLIITVPEKIKIPGIPKTKVIKPKWWLLHPALKKWYWERAQVPAFFAKEKLDWEYYPYPCPLPKFSKNLRAITVHDIIPWSDERYKSSRIKSFYHKKSLRALVQVDQLFTVSQSTHDELGIPAAALLPNAIPEIPKKLPKLSYKNDLVYLGGYDIRKQVPELLKAFKKVRKEFPEMQLLLIGKAHHKSKIYPEVPLQDGVHKLGALTDKKVYAILKSAFAFVHYSDSEGFNIPLLQAMASGTPAIVRDIAVNREVSKNSALFLGSHKKDLFDSVNLLRVKKKRDNIIKKQKEVAKKYTWKKSANILIKTLKNGSRS